MGGSSAFFCSLISLLSLEVVTGAASTCLLVGASAPDFFGSVVSWAGDVASVETLSGDGSRRGGSLVGAAAAASAELLLSADSLDSALVALSAATSAGGSSFTVGC